MKTASNPPTASPTSFIRAVVACLSLLLLPLLLFAMSIIITTITLLIVITSLGM